MKIFGVEVDRIINYLPFYGEAHSLVVSLVDTLAHSSNQEEIEQAIEDLNYIIAEHTTISLALQEIVKNYSFADRDNLSYYYPAHNNED
jgi:hypothetical protein